jgi:hypothetical protein
MRSSALTLSAEELTVLKAAVGHIVAGTDEPGERNTFEKLNQHLIEKAKAQG